MTTIVVIFDNARDVDQAVTGLGRAGFEDTVFDEGIIAGEAHSLGLVFAPGSAPPAVWGTPETASRRKPDHQTIVQAFKSHLADYHLPDETIKAYAMTFSHSGEFLLVRTENERAEAPSKSCEAAALPEQAGTTSYVRKVGAQACCTARARAHPGMLWGTTLARARSSASRRRDL